MEQLVDLTTEAFADALGALGARRAWLAPDPATGEVRASHAALDALAEHLGHCADWDDHEAVFLAVGPESGALFAAIVHRTARGQAQGGLRHWRYRDVGAFLHDGLRLARAMSRKNALAGLWWGGGKGLIARVPGERWRDAGFRRLLYGEYGRFVSSLGGCYVTAEDAGTTPDDLLHVFGHTRFVTCIPPELGGSGNPSAATATGVLEGMEAALAFAGLEGIRGRSFALQGLGHVGEALLAGLLRRGAARVVGADLDAERVRTLGELHRGAPVTLRVAALDDSSILSEACDLLAPNALGGVLGPETIACVGARVICGAANAQLCDEARDAEALAARGVLFVPDFVVNRMGIVQCANEQYGALRPDPAVERHLDPEDRGSVRATTRRVLERARAAGTTPLAAANQLADECLEQPHPIWGTRAQALVRGVLEGGWAAVSDRS